jgi:hypothetical protein
MRKDGYCPVSRDRIASDNNIGAGTVSNITDEWKRGVEVI